MSTPDFHDFLNIARRYETLIVDLCVEDDTISRAQLMYYLDHYHVPPEEKDGLIQALCDADILFVESNQDYTVNPAVSDIINYYERRGRLTSATFLREQISAVRELTDRLQRCLAAADPHIAEIRDTVDELYRAVREVREAGAGHYVACMRLFGDIKRLGNTKPIEDRIEDLQTAQRRHIDPLREFINPRSEYAQSLTALDRRMSELASRPELLAHSKELDSRRRRLVLDLNYVDHTLAANFGTLARTAIALLKSLLDEKRIKDAVAHCLGDLDATWAYFADTQVVGTGHRTFQAPGADQLEVFFADVVHCRLLPNPKPLLLNSVETSSGNGRVIQDAEIWRCIADSGWIDSWPAYVVARFAAYPGNAILKAIAFPLVAQHQRATVMINEGEFVHNFDDFCISMRDFSLKWESNLASE